MSAGPAGTDVEVRIARIVTQEVEMKQLVLRPTVTTSVLDGAIIRGEVSVSIQKLRIIVTRSAPMATPSQCTF